VFAVLVLPSPSATVFDSLRVVELAGDPAGEMTGKVLGQLGADVIKVEPPDGSPTRRIGPFAHDRPDLDHSLTFWYYNTNKRSAVIDYTTPQGKEALWRLLQRADVCITTLLPTEAHQLGLEASELSTASSSLIVLSITPFGLTGPWSERISSDLVGLALGSPLNSCGYDDHSIPPIRPGGDQGYQSAASFGQLGVLLALIERQRTGHGQLVDVAMHDCLAVGAELANPFWFYPRVTVNRQTCRHADVSPSPPAIFRCGDNRWVFFAKFLVEQKFWAAMVAWMDEKQAAVDLTDDKYLDPVYRQRHEDHIEHTIEAFLMQLTADEAYHGGQARGLAIGVLNSPDDVPEDEQLRARHFFVDVQHADGPPAPYPRVPFQFSAFSPVAIRRAPNLGEHTAQLIDDNVEVT
jgi:benzylsuccinate CoA-transferase BbsE subunit